MFERQGSMNILTYSKDVNSKNKRQHLKNDIIKYLSKSDRSFTIPELAKLNRLSVPTATSLVNELISEKWIIDIGKKNTESGRKPQLYTLNKSKFYVAGLQIGLKSSHFSICNIDAEVVFEKFLFYESLENTYKQLDEIIQYVNQCIMESQINSDELIGIGVGITGRVNSKSGISLNYFNFMEVSLSTYFEEKLGLTAIVENDTKIIGLAEQISGVVKSTNNAIVVNIAQGLGMTMIIHGELVSGNTGYSGEFGHMQFGTKMRPCICGKNNCLGTEVSGYALELDLAEALSEGSTSINFNKKSEPYNYKEILAAAQNGDGLAISLIQNQGIKLGKALGNIVNLLNPKLIVIGGEFTVVNELFIGSIKNGIKKSALIAPMKDCQVIPSTLGPNAEAMGAASLILKKLELL